MLKRANCIESIKQQNNELIKPSEHVRLFVQEVIDFSSQYGKENSNSYTVANIRSRPHYFPKYGDFLGKN
jgi:F-box/leucine-rich repeat protein 4